MVGDIGFLTSFTVLSGGIRSGLGLLVLPYLAAAGLIARGRLTLFFAAVASLMLIVSELWLVWWLPLYTHAMLQAGFLSIGYFAVAWLAFRLAAYAREKELLAEAREVDLAKQDEANRLIIRDMHDGVLVIDHQERIRHYNQQAQRLLGTEQPLDTLTLSQLGFLSGPLKDWATFGPADVSVTVPDTGQVVTLRIKRVGVDRHAGAVIFIQDSREEQRLAQQMKLAALGRLTANIAHEIRNPLSAITHATDLLGEENDEVTHTKLLRIVRDNAARLDAIVEDVLMLNRRDRARREQLSLNGFLLEFVREFTEVGQVASDWFQLDAHTAITVPFDREHLHQILWNLCRNAIRFCSQRPNCIALNLEKHGDDWRLEVSNDGPPIPPELQTQLFEPFFTTRSNGTGLGLYIARELASANGVDLSYIHLPAGACFRLTGQLT